MRVLPVVLLLAALPAFAQSGPSASDPAVSSDAQTCAFAGPVMEDVWDEFEEQALNAGCALRTGLGVKTGFCAAAHFTTGLSSSLVGWWNSAVGNSWATIGPRRLTPEVQSGTIQGQTARTFVGVAPVFSRTTVTVDKEGGQAPTEVTVCAYDRDGRSEVIARRSFARGRNTDLGPERLDVTGANGRMIAVNINGNPTNPLNRFEYEISYSTEPVRWDYPATGFADLHLHQAADLAQGSGWYWGSHAVDANAAEICDHTTLTGAVVDQLIPIGTNPSQHAVPVSVDLGAERIDHGSGPRDFSTWPSHEEIAHQQVHRNWLRTAHQNGLNLAVVSIVHNQPLCRMVRELHPHIANQQCEDGASIERQLEALLDFDEANDWYEIAVHPWHARKIIHEGKLAVVLSIESSNMFPASEGPLDTQLGDVYSRGVRSLQLAHEVDSRFAGAAPHMKVPFEVFQALRYPTTALTSLVDGEAGVGGFNYESGCSSNDPECKNSIGLKPQGHELVQRMVSRNMIVDVSHMSEQAVRDLHGVMVGQYDEYPFYASHSRFKPLLDAETQAKQREFVTTDEQIGFFLDVGGMVGVRTGNNAILSAPNRSGASGPAVANDCDGSAKSFAQLIDYADQRGLPIAYGTDLNGNIHQTGPRTGDDACPREGPDADAFAFLGTAPVAGTARRPAVSRTPVRAGTSRPSVSRPSTSRPSVSRPGTARPRVTASPAQAGAIQPGSTAASREAAARGIAHVGLLPGFHQDLKVLNTPGTDRLDQSAENFIRMWERTYDRSVQLLGAPALGTPQIQRGPARVIRRGTIRRN